jgi:hypothetical protein
LSALRIDRRLDALDDILVDRQAIGVDADRGDRRVAFENCLGCSPARLRLRPVRRVERAMVFRPVIAVSSERLHG